MLKEAAPPDVVSFLFLVLMAYYYVLPAGDNCRQPYTIANASAITVLNLLLGWTILGWIAAMVWAHTNNVSAGREGSG